MNQGRGSIRIDWTSTTIYAVFTALALGILIVFVGFVEDKLGAISWTILVTGLAGGTAIVLTLILRWYSAQLLDDATARVAAPLDRLGESFTEGSDAPVTRDELRTIRDDLLVLWPEVLRVVRIGLSVMFLMALMVELIALATAAVAYLQAERLEQQNTLLKSQSATQDVAFLNESLGSIELVVKYLDSTRTLVSGLENGLLFPFNFFDDDVSDVAGVSIENMIPDVCPSNEESSCNDMAADAIRDLIDIDGNLHVTDENEAALRGYYRLSRTAETVIQMFSALLSASFGTFPETSIPENIDKGGRLLIDADIACSPDSEGNLQDLWDGFRNMGIAAIEMWPIDSPSQIEPGKVMHFPALSEELEGGGKFLVFAKAIGHLDTTLNGNGSTVGGPEQAAIIFGQTLEALQAGIRKLADLCSNELHSLREQMILINQRRSDIVKSLRQASKLPDESSHGGVAP